MSGKGVWGVAGAGGLRKGRGGGRRIWGIQVTLDLWCSGCVCAWVCTCACMGVCVCTCMGVHGCVCAHVHWCVHVHVYMGVCVCVCMGVCTREAREPNLPRVKVPASGDLQGESCPAPCRVPTRVSRSPLLPGEKRKYLPPTSRQDPKFEELQKVQQLPVVSLLGGGILYSWGGDSGPPLPCLASGQPVGIPQVPRRSAE